MDDVFINEERLTRDSVMYRLLHGNFVNPFDNMDEDYKAVKMDMITEDQNSQEKNKNNATVNNDSQQEFKGKKMYVPGLVKRPCKFPKMSELNIEEQQACLRTLLTFSASEKPNLTVKDKKDLAIYFVSEIRIVLLLLIHFAMYCLFLKYDEILESQRNYK